jgi:acyl dehydratase
MACGRAAMGTDGGMIEKRWIGHKLQPQSVRVEQGQIALFCKAIGETRAAYLDLERARAGGLRGVPAPPTFAMCLEMLAREGALFELLERMGVSLGRGVHGEQGFTYHAPIYSGDTITFTTEVKDIYAKKGGALEFIVTHTRAVNQFGALVVELRNVAVARNEASGP